MADETMTPPDAATVAWLAEKGFALEQAAGVEGEEAWFLVDTGNGRRIGEEGFLTCGQAVEAVKAGDVWLAEARRFLDGDLGRPVEGGGSAGG